MINKDKFTKLTKQITRSNSGAHNLQIMHPTRDWTIGLVVGLVIFIVSVTWSSQTYLKYRVVSVGEHNTEQTEIVVYRESLVKDTLAEFAAREEQYRSLTETASAANVTPVFAEAVPAAATASSSDSATTSLPAAMASSTNEL